MGLPHDCLVAFGIILDDIVFPDGHTAMGTLGGGGPQTAFGMRLPALAGWTEQCQVGLVAGVGRDLPQSAREWLTSAGIDQAGVRQTELPTPRAWQVLEADGRRTQVWRVGGHVIGAQLGRSLEHIPESYREACGFHLGIHPEEPGLEFIRQLPPSPRGLPLVSPHTWQVPGAWGCATPAYRPQTANRRPPLVSLELFKPADHPPTDAALRQLCAAADILSLNFAEAQSLVDASAPQELVYRLADAGARMVTLRMGADGSLVYAKEKEALIHVPAVPTTVIDPTGAGNAYSGGFLAGYLQTGDLMTAARYASVAASFLVEQVGLPPVTDHLRAEANRRLKHLTVARAANHR